MRVRKRKRERNRTEKLFIYYKNYNLFYTWHTNGINWFTFVRIWREHRRECEREREDEMESKYEWRESDILFWRKKTAYVIYHYTSLNKLEVQWNISLIVEVLKVNMIINVDVIYKFIRI